MKWLVIAAAVLLFLVAITYSEEDAAFVFARLKYPGIRDETYIKNYYTDYPQADEHLVVLINRLTGIKAATALVHIDDNIFQYPLIYIVEPAQMNLTDTHIGKLREYTARGGFILMDDIHGDDDMMPLTATFERVFPEESFVELSTSHELFHAFFDIDTVIQVVHDGIAMCKTCQQWENGPSGEHPRVLAHYGTGGIDVIVMVNNDLGDALEWADDRNYPREMSIFAVKALLNTVIYALSH